MQIQIFERDSKHKNANLNHWKGIRNIRMQIRTIRTKFEAFERNSKHLNANLNQSKGIWTILMQIPTLPTKFEAFECICWEGFEPLECKFEPFKQDSKHSNANSNHWKGTLTIQMQIRTIPTRFETFKCKF